jgi:hypothetical protein
LHKKAAKNSKNTPKPFNTTQKIKPKTHCIKKINPKKAISNHANPPKIEAQLQTNLKTDLTPCPGSGD